MPVCHEPGEWTPHILQLRGQGVRPQRGKAAPALLQQHTLAPHGISIQDGILADTSQAAQLGRQRLWLPGTRAFGQGGGWRGGSVNSSLKRLENVVVIVLLSQSEVSDARLDLLQMARTILKRPWIIVSGALCNQRSWQCKSRRRKENLYTRRASDAVLVELSATRLSSTSALAGPSCSAASSGGSYLQTKDLSKLPISKVIRGLCHKRGGWISEQEDLLSKAAAASGGAQRACRRCLMNR